jgi:hypothetical protein
MFRLWTVALPVHQSCVQGLGAIADTGLLHPVDRALRTREFHGKLWGGASDAEEKEA